MRYLSFVGERTFQQLYILLDAESFDKRCRTILIVQTAKPEFGQWLRPTNILTQLFAYRDFYASNDVYITFNYVS